MAEKKVKTVPALDIGYSDKTGVIVATDPKADDAEVDTLNVREMAGAETPEPMILACIRYFSGYGRDAVAAAQKGKKDVYEAIRKAFKAIRDNTLQFRERGGEGGLSTEQEFSIIAGVLVALKAAATEDEARTKIQAAYDQTKEVVTPAKGTAAVGTEGQPGYVAASEDYREEKKSLTRPLYRKLKAVTAVAEALAKAQKVDSADELAELGFDIPKDAK